MKKTRFSHDYVVLLTATLNPGEYAVYLDPQSLEYRKQDYVKALEFWVDYPDERIKAICFCENSGANLDFLARECDGSDREVEFLSFDGNHRPDGMHYGYSELGLLDHAFQNSRLLTQYQYFLKVTGRLTFPLTKPLLDQLTSDLDFAADAHRYRHDKDLPARLRTQIFLSSTRFYRETFVNSRNQMPPGTGYLEEFMMQLLWKRRNDENVILRFPIECQPVGYSATARQPYHKGISNVKSQIRSLTRKLLPSLWL